MVERARKAGKDGATSSGLEGSTPMRAVQCSGVVRRTPAVGRTPGPVRSVSSLGATPLGPLPTFPKARGKAQSRSEPTTPRGSRPSSLEGSDTSSNLADRLGLLDEEGSRTADNVRVLVRVRPLNEREQQDAGSKVCVTTNGQAVVFSDPSRASEPFVQGFDGVFGPEAGQEEVHRVAGISAVEHCLAGYNSSVFAYGQTGSGKTYTMAGGEQLARLEDGQLPAHCGLMPRVFDLLFSRIAEEEQQKANVYYSVECSFLEVYNEEVSDLLQPSNTGLQIRDGDLSRGVYVERLSEHSVLNADEVMELIDRGSANRHIAATKMNERSSRSHSVFTAHVTAHEKAESGLTNVRYSKLNLIDLAGSERVGKSGATGDQLNEAKNINKSLTVLGRVISALVEQQRKPSVHVPIRDSRLTFLLQESLGGNSRTTIIANVTASADCAQETHSTLVFSAGAKRIRNHAVRNEDVVGDLKTLQQENSRLQALIRELQAKLQATESAALQELLERSGQLERALEWAQEEADQQRLLFDQNNLEIGTLKAECGVMRKELSEEKAARAQLHGEHAALTSELVAAQEQAAAAQEDAAALCQALQASTSMAQAAEKEGHALRMHIDQTQAELQRCRHELEATKMAMEAETQTLLDELELSKASNRDLQQQRAELEIELHKAQREAADGAEHAASIHSRMQSENAELYQAVQSTRRDAEQLKTALSTETVTTIKYRRMVADISKLIEWAQNVNSPGGARATSPTAALALLRGPAGSRIPALGDASSNQNALVLSPLPASQAAKLASPGKQGQRPQVCSPSKGAPLSTSKLLPTLAWRSSR